MILNTIQKNGKLNVITTTDEKAHDGANHNYLITNIETEYPVGYIRFQKGARNSPNSVNGVLDADLLEIVRDRLKGFQSGRFASSDNAEAIAYIEEALMCLNRRVEDRISRNVLGKEEV